MSARPEPTARRCEGKTCAGEVRHRVLLKREVFCKLTSVRPAGEGVR